MYSKLFSQTQIEEYIINIQEILPKEQLYYKRTSFFSKIVHGTNSFP